MEKMNLYIDHEPGNPIIIREGKALELKPPEKIKLSGDIHTVGRFLNKEHTGLQKVDNTRAIINVDRAGGEIELTLDPEDFYSPVITASLEMSDELKIWLINDKKMFTREELVKLIRFNKLHFDNADIHASVLESYQKFSAQTASEMNLANDNRGNKTLAYKKDVSTTIPTEFILNVPIFKWESKKRFRVEIAMDNTEASWRFWFESVELYEMMQTEKDAIFNQELDAFKDQYVIISK